MKRFLLSLIVLVASVSYALAQNPVITNPSTRTLNNLSSGTITATSTFQSVFAPNERRYGCALQNKSASNDMYVFFGSATEVSLRSIKLAPGAVVLCAAFGTVLTDEVSVMGTAGDTFYASQY